MNFFRKLHKKIKDGSLRQMLRELRWMGRYTRRRSVALYLGLSLTGVVMGLGTGIAGKRVIDAVTGFSAGALVPAAVAWGVLQILRIGSGVLSGRLSAAVRLKTEHSLRADIYDRILQADYEEISRFHSGDLLSRLESDGSAVASSVLGWLPELITRLAQLLGALGVILYYDPTLAVLALLSAPVTLALSVGVMGKMRGHSQKMRQISAELTAFHEESFQNVQAVKSFGLRQVYSRRLLQLQGKRYDTVMGYTRFQTAASAGLNLVGAVISAVCFGWGVYRLWQGRITYGTMMLFLQMSGTVTGAFSALVHLFPAAVGAATAAGRLMAVTELRREEDTHGSEAEAMRRAGGVCVTVKDVTFGYAGRANVLENVNFSAEPGQTVALIGPSGGGKTTTLRLLLGVLRPQGGTVTLTAGGKTLPASPSTRRLFAYVPQTSSLFSGTVAENLRLLAPEATEEAMLEALSMACAKDFVMKLPQGLNSPVAEQGGGFSQGQIQRLMLARALLSGAPVLLLDEATSALDPQTEAEVLKNMMALKQSRTCIVTTHRQSVLRLCDRCYRVQDGHMELTTETTWEENDGYDAK